MSASATTWRFSPGDWYAVVADEVAVVLPPSERSRVSALWELADAGAGAEELLDAVLVAGLSGLSDLVLVTRTTDATRVLVRGAARATVGSSDGSREVAARPGTVWSEQVVAGATAGRVDLGPGGGIADREIGSGLVRVSALEFGTAADVVERPAGEEPDERPVRPEPPAPRQTDQVEALPEPAEDGWSDRDGQTTAGVETPDFARPPVPGQEHAPAVVSSPVATLVFSTGDVVEVDRTVLVGRAPEARGFASHDRPRTVTVPSPQQEISSTHLEIRPGAGADHGSAIVTDLGSTNGTVLVQPGLPPEDLHPGIAVSLLPGAVLDLGDGVTVQVTGP